MPDCNDMLEANSANVRKIFRYGVTEIVAVSTTTNEQIPICYLDGNRSSAWKLIDSKGQPMILRAV